MIVIIETNKNSFFNQLKTLNTSNESKENYQQHATMINQISSVESVNYSPIYTTPTQIPTVQQQQQQYSPEFTNNNYFNPEEIFQLDQPIKPYNHHFTNMDTGSNFPKSPPTVLDLESGTIHKNYIVKNEFCDVNELVRYEMDDTMSLTSGSSASLFDDGFYYTDSGAYNNYPVYGHGHNNNNINNYQNTNQTFFPEETSTFVNLNDYPSDNNKGFSINFSSDNNFYGETPSQEQPQHFNNNNSLNNYSYYDGNNFYATTQQEQCAF